MGVQTRGIRVGHPEGVPTRWRPLRAGAGPLVLGKKEGESCRTGWMREGWPWKEPPHFPVFISTRILGGMSSIPGQIHNHKKEKPLSRRWLRGFAMTNVPDRTRTCGLLLRRQSLYPPELRGPQTRKKDSPFVAVLVGGLGKGRG